MRSIRVIALWVACIALVAINRSIAMAQTDADPVMGDLQTAKAAQTQAIGQAAATLSTAIDAKVKSLTASGDADSAKVLSDQKSAFVAAGTLPQSPLLKDAVDQYRQSVKDANDTLATAYATAIEGFDKEDKTDLASQARRDRNDLLAQADRASGISDGPSGMVPAPELIAQDLDAAKSAHRKAQDDAKSTLVNTINDRINAATDAGNLTLVQTLQGVLATASVDGSVPDNTPDAAVVAAKKTYDMAIVTANNKLNLAYQKAVRDYTRARQLALAQSTQNEMNSIGLVDPLAPTAITTGTYQLGSRLPNFLESKDLLFATLSRHLGIVVPEMHYIRTKEGDLLNKNFTFDVWCYMVKGMQGDAKLPAALIGLGDGSANLVNGGPQDAIYLEINPPDQNGGEINLHERQASKKVTFGHLKEFDTYIARIQKSGNSLTFTVGTEQSGSLVPESTITIADLRGDSPYLNDQNGHLFFGSGAFKQLSIGKGPAPVSPIGGAAPLTGDTTGGAVTPAGKTIKLSVRAVIDMDDELIITRTSARWKHHGGDWPVDVSLNNIPMDPHNELLNSGTTAFLDPNADLGSMTIISKRGRGTVDAMTEHGAVVVKFSDPDSGSDGYGIDLEFKALDVPTPVLPVAPAPPATAGISPTNVPAQTGPFHISVLSANYGAGSRTIDVTARAIELFDKVGAMEAVEHDLQVTRDPAPNVHKQLTVRFQAGNEVVVLKGLQGRMIRFTADKTPQGSDAANGQQPSGEIHGHAIRILTAVYANDVKSFDVRQSLVDLLNAGKVVMPSREAFGIADAFTKVKTLTITATIDSQPCTLVIQDGGELALESAAGATPGASAISPTGAAPVPGELAPAPAKLGDLFAKSPIGEVMRFEGHVGATRGVQFTRDGRAVLSSGVDKKIRLWSLETGKEIRVFEGHTDSVNILAPIAENGTFCTASTDHTVRLWDLNETTPIYKFQFKQDCWEAALSPDGQSIVVADNGTNPQVLSCRTHEPHPGFVADASSYAAAWSPDGKFFATGGWNRITHVYDATTLKEVYSLAQADQVYGIAFSPDGSRLLSSDRGHIAHLWDLGNGKELRIFEMGTQPVRIMAFSPSSKYAILPSDASLMVWNLADGTLVHRFDGHADIVRGLAISPDGRLAASTSDDGTVRVWLLPDLR